MKKPRLAPLGCALLLAFAAPAQAWTVKNASNETQLKLTDDGNFGIGAPTPGAKLDVAGQVKITGGSPGAGKVLTSDAAGLASWQVAAAGGECLLPTGYIKQGGLTWSPAVKATKWEYAKTYCTSAIGGQTGWRMPTKDELVAMVNTGALTGAPVWVLGPTWASDIHSHTFYWIVSTESGTAWGNEYWRSNYVTCVR